MSDHDPKAQADAPTEAEAPPTERPPPGDEALGAFRPQSPVRPGPPPLRPQGTRNSSLPPPVRPIGIPRPPDGPRPKLPPPPPPARPATSPGTTAASPDRNRAAIARAEQEIARLQIRLKTLETREEERKRHAGNPSDVSARLAAIEAKHAADWNALAARLGALEAKHGMDASALAARIDEVEASHGDAGTSELRARIDAIDTRIELLDQHLSEATGRESAAPQPATDAASRLDAIETKLEALENAQHFESARLRDRLDAVEGGGGPGGGLRRIKGIGPKYERLLQEAGVTDVAHIAAWTDADVERFAGVLNIAANRIRNAGWVEIARELSGSR